MPIEVNTTIEACDQEAFHALNRQLMGVIPDVNLYREALFISSALPMSFAGPWRSSAAPAGSARRT
jgi:hypothetical protein